MYYNNPSKEYEFVNGVGIIPNIMENNPVMFETTNKWLLTIINHY